MTEITRIEIERQKDLVRSLFDAEAVRMGFRPGHAWFYIRFALINYVEARGWQHGYDQLRDTVGRYYRDPERARAVLSECLRLARSAMREPLAPPDGCC